MALTGAQRTSRYRARHRERVLLADCIHQKSSAKRKRDQIQAIKLQHGCADCGYAVRAEALQFDHIGDDKLFNIGSHMSRPMEILLAEIAKCEVVCANCHAVRTADRALAARMI